MMGFAKECLAMNPPCEIGALRNFLIGEKCREILENPPPRMLKCWERWRKINGGTEAKALP
jgi:hypothetical protein